MPTKSSATEAQAPGGASVADAEALIEATYRHFVMPLLPDRVWDIHSHLGSDDDGGRQTPEAFLAELATSKVERAVVFPFRAVPPYGPLNAEILAAAAAAPAGELIPFCRSEPGPSFEQDLTRALECGARGIKLHPSTGVFEFADPCVALACEIATRFDVPILLHAGRNVAPFADDVAALLAAHPQVRLILAHCAISDMSAASLRSPNLVFDTSVWNCLDIVALLSVAAPEQAAFATDAPYYRQSTAQAKVAMALRALGASDADFEAVFAGNARRLLGEGGGTSLTRPLGAPVIGLRQSLRRAHEYLMMALAYAWRWDADVFGALTLARRALPDSCEHARAAAELIECAAALWPEEVASAERTEKVAVSLRTCRLIELADSLVVGAGLIVCR